MKKQEEKESVLIKNLIDGDRSSFDKIYDMYAGRLYAFSFDFCKTREEAEDIVQDVFIKLWLIRSKIRNTDNVKSLLFAMTRNALIKSWKTKTQIQFEGYSEADTLTTEDSSELEYAEMKLLVRHYISMLTPTQRKVVQMSRFEHKQNSEIAESMGLTVQTVKNALSQGLKSLRLNLGSFIIIIIASL